MNRVKTTYLVAVGSDLFHESVSDLFIEDVFAVMNASNHDFEIMTKRIERVAQMDLDWSDNIKLGVSVESYHYSWRIKFLQKIQAKFKYVSAMPLLDSLGKIDLDGIHVVGASREDWGLFRPFKQEWMDVLKQQCNDQGVMFSESATLWESE
jgi:protein gp37